MGKVTIEFTVTWNGRSPAALDYLRDGGIEVPLDGEETTGVGEIEVHYLANDTGVHEIKWGLVFPGEKISGLAATARIRSGTVQTLAQHNDEQEHQWTGEGRAVG